MSDERNPILDAARAYVAAGISVIPLTVAIQGRENSGKAPTLRKGAIVEYGTRLPTDDELVTWFSNSMSRNRNLGIVCGQVSRLLVLDLDSDETRDYWLSELNISLDSVCWVKTGRGIHLYFRIPAGREGRNIPNRRNDGETLRGYGADRYGGHVVAPPSKHYSGTLYEWGRPLDCLTDAPEVLLVPIETKVIAKQTKSRSKAVRDKGKRSSLAELVADARGLGAGQGRNELLTKIVGHLVKQGMFTDAIRELVLSVNATFSAPLPLSEIEKMIPSVVSGDKERHPVATKGTGSAADTDPSMWLVSAGDRIMTLAKVKTEDGFAEIPREWANFDMRVLSCMLDESGNGFGYNIRVTRKGDAIPLDSLITDDDLKSDQALTAYLTARGLVIPTTKGTDAFDRRPGTSRERLLAYLTTQARTAPRLTVVPYLGWNDEHEAFVTYEGVITENGLAESTGLVPDPQLAKRRWVSHYYGFGSVDEAR